MTPQAALLKATIEADIKEIEALYRQLSAYSSSLTNTEQAILAGYYLHNLYTAFENICLNVARAFENQIDDRSQWHSVLLKRMTLDIEGVRPRLWSAETYCCLDELRRFRHVFRNAYTVSLDPQRISLVIEHAQPLKEGYQAELQQFMTFLESMT